MSRTPHGKKIAAGQTGVAVTDRGFTQLLFDDSPEAHGHGKILGHALGL